MGVLFMITALPTFQYEQNPGSRILVPEKLIIYGANGAPLTKTSNGNIRQEVTPNTFELKHYERFQRQSNRMVWKSIENNPLAREEYKPELMEEYNKLYNERTRGITQD